MRGFSFRANYDWRMALDARRCSIASATLRGGVKMEIDTHVPNRRSRILVAFITLACLGVPLLASAQSTLLPLGRASSDFAYSHWIDVRFPVRDSATVPWAIEAAHDLSSDKGTSHCRILTGFEGRPVADVSGEATWAPGAYGYAPGGNATAMVTYLAQIYGAHPALGNQLIPVIVVANGQGSGVAFQAAVTVYSSAGGGSHTWYASSNGPPSFEVGEQIDLPANQVITVQVRADCSWYAAENANVPCTAHADPQFFFDQAEFDRRMGASTFPLAAYFTLRYSDGIAAPTPKAASADFDHNLKSDILWRHSTDGDVWRWPMEGTTRVSEDYVRTVAEADWEIRGLGDQTGDGKADILWRNKTTGQIYFWPMNGSAPLHEIYVGTVSTGYHIVGTGDFNGDGKSDILWRNLTNGEVWIWLMDGATRLNEVYVDGVDLGYVVKGIGDLTGDGKADIAWHHATTGEVWVWPMEGTYRLAQVWVATVPDTGYQIQAVADFDGNARADILWWHATSGEAWIWTMNGTTREAETYVGTVPDTSYRIQAAGDYDGDGKADILWHHATQGDVWVWLMDGTTRLSENYVWAVPDAGYQIVHAK
jgi:hypothetical protein